MLPGVDFVTKVKKTLSNAPEADTRWREFRLPFVSLSPKLEAGNSSVSWVMTSYVVRGPPPDMDALAVLGTFTFSLSFPFSFLCFFFSRFFLILFLIISSNRRTERRAGRLHYLQ